MENIERNRSTQAILIRRNKIKENLRFKQENLLSKPKLILSVMQSEK